MSTRRSFHQSVLLPDGRVLITGGVNVNSLESAEVYDPNSGGFNLTDSMSAARALHTATLLLDGTVLISGGFNLDTDLDISQWTLDSAEIFDPATEEFRPTGSLTNAATRHTATLLDDGRVLLAGGYSRLAQLYDPASGSFSETGSMIVRRTEHTATRLADGRVLITGGFDATIQNSTEIYDPATGVFSPAGSMHDFRHAHTATLLPSGQVLIVGGKGGSIDTVGVGRPVRTAELYDPETGDFTVLETLSASAVSNHAAVLLNNGQVLIAGTYNCRVSLRVGVIDDCGDGYLYDTDIQTFTPLTGGRGAPNGLMNLGRHGHVAELLPNGNVLIAGGIGTEYIDGFRSPIYTATAEVFTFP